MVRSLSWAFGALVGLMSTCLFVAGNLFNTPVFEHLRGLYPNFFALPWYVWLLRSGMALLALAGLVTALRTQSWLAAVKVCALSGLISSSIGFVTWMGITITFHDAMMKDRGNVHEYELSVPTPPTEEQLSDFIYSDGLEGALIMMFEGPLAGMLLGGIGGGGGMLLVLAFQKRFRARSPERSAKMRYTITPLPLHDPV